MLAFDVINAIGPVAGLLGIASMTGGALLYSKTKDALEIQADTIAALDSGLAESRRLHAECEDGRVNDRVVNEKARAVLQAQIEEVKAHNVAEFVTAIEKTVTTVVRRELDGTPGRDAV